MIHHATKARAKKLGIILTEEVSATDTIIVRAFQPSTGREVYAFSGKIALNRAELGAEFGSEYSHIKVYSHAVILEVKGKSDLTLMEMNPEETVNVMEIAGVIFDKIADLTDLAEFEPADLGSDNDDDDDEYTPKSVVKSRYKEEYLARGDPSNNSDWLSKTIGPWTKPGKKLDIEALEAIFDANGVKYSHYNRSTPGWQGRLAMSGRVVLRGHIATSGVLIIPAMVTGDDELRIEVPAMFRGNK